VKLEAINDPYNQAVSVAVFHLSVSGTAIASS